MPIEVVSAADKWQYADPALVKAAIAPELSNGFFGVDLRRIRDKLLQVPWVIGAQVQRKWPNSIVFTLQERQALARWGQDGVIDATGKLFFPPQKSIPILQGIPEFVGDAKRVTEMVDTYSRIIAKIKPLGLTVVRLVIMPDNGWQAMLNNGVMLILGQNELEERLTRFVLAYGDRKSVLHKTPLRIVDLRYTNGLAASG